ncbi:MAG TPA: nucleoside hydrolase [Phycisphaerales bacterium]|nr:nucleoside hydrolase [Phycisphaerales bacterium]
MTTREPTEKVLLDTDIGTDIDDALALAYLLCEPRCELVGVTTVSGEAHRRAEMVSAVCRHVGRTDVPIHVGCDRAMIVDLPQKDAAQASALGSRARQAFTPGNTAIEFLRRTIRENPGQITLLAIGPMTNVGVLFATDPEIPALLKQLVLMCGQFFTSMGGEWNAINDPHATAITYGNTFHARPPKHVSFGLDVTMRCVLPADECRKKFTAHVLEPVRDFAEVWFRKASHVTFHDPLAAASIFQPDLCRYRKGRVSVSLHAPTLGWTIFNPKATEPPLHEAACEVDPDRFFERFFQIVR